MDEWTTRSARAHAAAIDAALARADALVRDLLEELNRALLGGHGTLTAASAGSGWGAYLWELRWEPADGRERYVLVALLRDSRGTPYLKVQRRRLALSDALLQRRLRWALEVAFRQPWATVSAEEAILRRLDNLMGLAPRDSRSRGS